MLLRAITPQDWDAILQIQAECYSQLDPEPLHVLQSKWQVSPQSCFVFEVNNAVVGYCLAHPWTVNIPPALYEPITHLPKANTLYLHDIAISAKAQGLGAGTKALTRLKLLADRYNLDSLSLVAVQGADSYWLKMGFKPQTIDKCLGSYTNDAMYMIYNINRRDK
ncbi:GNAT family N-acetyltransferase [Shewanella sp. HN-41]|uniref:GNAT family N-acetyltransferase n=1 Tax=Shewanella sp. HN-41 TaxID=327275 RepID=UPI00021265E9|nr:GNAT family N-acetyltransferase [Shewanella sp. HN-41]EGM70794.1 GCN5 N-acetyltransferase [Shewanella sp. HN-41]